MTNRKPTQETAAALLLEAKAAFSIPPGFLPLPLCCFRVSGACHVSPQQCVPPGQNWSFCVAIVVGLLSGEDVILHRVTMFLVLWRVAVPNSSQWLFVHFQYDLCCCTLSFPSVSDLCLLNETPVIFWARFNLCYLLRLGVL